MKRLLIVGESARQRAYIKQACGKSFLIDDATELTDDTLEGIPYSAVVVMLDENPDFHLKAIEHFTLSPSPNLPPVLIATKSPASVYVRKALRRGAIDYIDLNRHFFLIQNRILNIMKLSAIESAHVEAVNRFFFYKSLGPAEMLEVSDDGIVHVLMINNDFFEMTGLPKNYYDNCTNLLDTVLPEELETTKAAIAKAIEDGWSEVTFSRRETNQTFRGYYRLVLREEHSSILLITLRDVTDREKEKSMNQNMLKLPGMTLFSYDRASDSLSVLLNTKKDGNRIARTHDHIMEPDKQHLIAPESYPLFQRTMKVALEKKITGNIDVRCLHEGDLKWFRLYYRSIPDLNGQITHIVGRLDDLENEDWMDVKGIQSGLCDAETHLPTFRTASQFIDQVLHEHKQGILMLLYITGLENACKSMTTENRQIFLQNIVRSINNHFISTDIIGRFDEECFMIFMPETNSYNLAEKKASTLIQIVDHLLPDKNMKAKAGISVIGPHHGSLESIISEASIALWKSVRSDTVDYIIIEEEHPD